MSAACCVCYTTDSAYLFPSFVSAMQARRQTSADKADIAIFSFGASPAAEHDFQQACAAEGIRFLPVSLALIDNAEVMLARLFLNRLVPAEYDQFLYIDSDTQVTGSLDPLIEFPVPAGQFLAANDPMTFALSGTGSHSRRIIEHFEAVGISPHESSRYFNTGVLRINRDGWEEIGLGAWKLFQKNLQVSRFPDQDVLNITGGIHRIPMSLAWNFPVYMRNSRVEAQIEPRIYHFMGSPKPWHGVFPPWSRQAHQPYLQAIKKYPNLASYLSVMPRQKRFRYTFQQYYKKVLETFTWGLSDKRGRILSYESAVAAKSKTTGIGETV
jgi:lipopolysaccharide biosynthesis glycosyltransferase